MPSANVTAYGAPSLTHTNGGDSESQTEVRATHTRLLMCKIFQKPAPPVKVPELDTPER